MVASRASLQLTQTVAITFAKKAWMNEDMMNRWINQVLIPRHNKKATDIIPLLILDAY